MARFLVLLFAALAAAGCIDTAGPAVPTSVPGGAPQPLVFRAMTFNVRYGTADDGEDAWPQRRERLAQRIEAFAPHLLGVQEALDFQVAFLEERLPHHRRIGQGREGGANGEHAALFVDERVFEVVASGDFWLSETPEVVASVGWDAALTRICSFACLRSRLDRRELCAWNVHLDHRGERAREESARLVARRMATTSGPHLLLGDLNSGESSAPLDVLRTAGLHDTFREIEPAAAAVGTFHAFRGGCSGEKIDFILADHAFTTRAAAIDAAADANGRWPSDHHPVTATLQF